MDNNFILASLEGITNEITSLNKAITHLKIEQLAKFSKFSYNLYQKDSEYNESYNKLLDTLDNASAAFRIQINDGIILAEKWFSKYRKPDDFTEFCKKNETAKNYLQKISVEARIFHTNLIAILRLYEREIQVWSKTLNNSNDKETKALAQNVIALYKDSVSRIKGIISEHISYSKKVSKKHKIISDFHIFDV